MKIFLFLALVIAVAFIVLTVQNPTMVITLDFINWTFSGPPAVMLSVPFVAGIMTGVFLVIPAWWKKSMQARSCKKQAQDLETELSNIIRHKAEPEDQSK
jgi:uncharacterized integral membrane protein